MAGAFLESVSISTLFVLYKLFMLLFRRKIKRDVARWLRDQEVDVETLLWAKELHDGTYESLNHRDSVIRELIGKLHESMIS